MKENGLDTIRKDMDFLEKQWERKKGIFKDASNEKLAKELLKEKKKLEVLKREEPEQFEEYYWEIYSCVKVDSMVVDTFARIVTGVLAALLSLMSFNFSIVDALSENIYWKSIIGIIMLIFGAGEMVTVFGYLKSIWNVRERSCYKILLAFLEELRNAETEGDQACIVQNAEVK